MADAKDFAAPDAIWRPAPNPEPPKWRAFRLGEFKMPMVIRGKTQRGLVVVATMANEKGIWFRDNQAVSTFIPYEDLRLYWERSDDGLDPWLPCGVEVKP